MDHQPVLGILGSGQLARMLALAAYPLGIRVAVLDAPAKGSGMGWTLHPGDFNQPADAIAFAGSVDVVTLENEFVAQEALEAITASGRPLRPTASSVELVQDKLVQKQTLARSGVTVPRFQDTPTREWVLQAGLEFGWPIVLKRRRLGYDGKGNALLQSANDIAAAWARLDGDRHPLYAEAFCPFTAELAQMITRGLDGAVATYPLVSTVQKDHICHTVTAPADVAPDIAASAAEQARRAVSAFGGVGTWGVEMFLLPDHSILVNELAPRVHNSGHYTIEACECSQFENHVRAVLGMPLGSTALRAPAAAMVNLLGADNGPGWPTGLDAALAVPGAHVHVYGKQQSVAGRKMGHVTALGPDPATALATAQRAASLIRFGM